MNDITLDQNDEELLTYEVSDEALEGAALQGKSKHVHSVGLHFLLFLPRSLTRDPTVLPALYSRAAGQEGAAPTTSGATSAAPLVFQRLCVEGS
jgi:hypothetical protein